MNGAFNEAFSLVKGAIDRAAQPVKDCGNCALFVECQHAIGVDEGDCCHQWRANDETA